jgi:hypothetical protein
MDNSRRNVQARESLLAILIILSGIIIETAYTSGPGWYALLLLNIPAIFLLTSRSKNRSQIKNRDFRKVKQLQWLQ